MKKSFFDLLWPSKPIYAHCDIPCGIYDPHAAQVASHTVVRMTKMLLDLNEPDSTKAAHQISRLNRVKEDHAEIVKNEVRIIWGDFFKPEHLEKYPELHEMVFQILKMASKAKQEINLEAAEQLLAATQKFAEVFFKAKGVEPVRVKSIFPTEGEIVVHK